MARWLIILWATFVGISLIGSVILAHSYTKGTTELFAVVVASLESQAKASDTQDAFETLRASSQSLEATLSGPSVKLSYGVMCLLALAAFAAAVSLLLKKPWAVNLTLVVLALALAWQTYTAFAKEKWRMVLEDHYEEIYHSASVVAGTEIKFSQKLKSALKPAYAESFIMAGVDVLFLVLLLARRKRIQSEMNIQQEPGEVRETSSRPSG